jgi:hypothetical protein
MNQVFESIDALRTTVNSLKATGIDAMSIAVSLAALSVSVYREIIPQQEITEADMQILFKNLAMTSEKIDRQR